jgi:hypothetical protein
VAGHGVLLNGYRVVVPFDGIVAEKGTDAEIRDITQGFEDCGMKGWATQPYYDRIIRAGAVHVREAAMRVFGIDQLDTDSTFWALP